MLEDAIQGTRGGWLDGLQHRVDDTSYGKNVKTRDMRRTLEHTSSLIHQRRWLIHDELQKDLRAMHTKTLASIDVDL